MTLASGTRLGPYEIASPLGAGGMGEVYRARDTRLGRTVALKVLPSHLAASPELRQRFEREARAISALNHPHICVLHDVGHQDGIDFLVMEYLEGETLDDRLKRGPLPLEQVLRYGVEIAEALDRAHRQGIVHRDLKPGNLMLTKSGTKLLDFGLAKLRAAGAPPLAELTSRPTEAKPLTAEGSIVGTVQYMAPEQLEGKEPDARTDIFALGTVLYEMATGRRAFTGNSQASLVAAILTSNPAPISRLQPLTPPALDRAVTTCLAKDPDERWQNAHDLASELRWIAAAGSQAGVAAPVAARRWGWTAAGVLVAAAIALGLGLRLGQRPPVSGGVTRRATVPLRGLGDTRGPGSGIALSADGASLVSVGGRGSAQKLYLRRLDALDAVPIPGTESGLAPFLSPDGRMLGFERESEILVMPLSGGAPSRVRGARFLVEGQLCWMPDGRIVYTGQAGGLVLVRADGSEPETLTRPEPGTLHLSPRVLPDGREILYTEAGGDIDDAAIASVSIDARRSRRLVAGAMSPQYADGHLLYVLPDGALMAAPFDAERGQVTGKAVDLGDRVSRTRFGVAHYAAVSGLLLYLPRPRSLLVEVDRAGRSAPLLPDLGSWHHPRYSPDGGRIVLDQMDASGRARDVWVLDRAGKTLSRITRVGDAHDPAWLPSGNEASFFSFKGGGGPLMIAAADGSREPRPVRVTAGFPPADLVNPGAWLPDGRAYLAGVREGGGPSDIWSIPADGSAPSRLVGSPSDEHSPAISADGRWLALSERRDRPGGGVRETAPW